MIETNEVLLKNNNDWLYFSHPHKVLTAARLDKVQETLKEVENLVNVNGWHAAGFVSYEAAPAFDSALHVRDADDFPLLWFGLYSKPRVVKTSEVFAKHPAGHPVGKDLGDLVALNWQTDVERESYNAAIEKIKDYITKGRTYQVNFTMRLNSEFKDAGWDFFLNLAQNQHKYAAYMDIGRYTICSVSPELFFKLDGDKIYSSPMKGTAKRGRTTLEDKAQVEWLQSSVKNHAENVMIVDMVRNDLGRIAEIGSVNVPELFKIEKYPTLFQMTSTVQAKTSASLDQIFSALFPCASITGAPKISTMSLIAELETTPRKIYTGSIGYFSPGRQAQFNVAIRTALIDKEYQQAEYGIGGGIVWDSTSTDEYSEALLKARVLTERSQEFSLFETILWTPREGYFLLEKHIARMADSAEYFDFPFLKEKLAGFLNQISRDFQSPKRTKVVLNRWGKLTDETIDFDSREKPFKVCFAKYPIDSNHVFLFHKTTRREIYPVPKNECDDILLFNEKNELTEFTIGNLVVEVDDEFFTPPISCGLLAGTFRAHLLETNQIKERVIYRDELPTFSKIFSVNSLRKWMEVQIQKEPM